MVGLSGNQTDSSWGAGSSDAIMTRVSAPDLDPPLCPVLEPPPSLSPPATPEVIPGMSEQGLWDWNLPTISVQEQTPGCLCRENNLGAGLG